MEPFKRAVEAAKDPSLFLLSSWMEQYGSLTTGFTGREGGSSEAPWGSLNCGLHVGDDEAAVIHNRRRLTDALAWPFEAWTCAEQVHGHQVYQVTNADRGKGRASRQEAIQAADALMTDEKGILLTSFYADCVPLYFYDPANEAVALAHAGWKGTVQEIARHTIEAMARAYGSRPEQIRTAIGPSIGACCYEVYGTVYSQVRELAERLQPVMETMKVAVQAPLQPAAEGKARINLKELNRQIMIKAGILPMNIEMSQWCTGCRTDYFFSHRMESGNTGRMISWIGMRRGEEQA
ncbi:peptidoglycan editing factor PgeF [Paenibacillus sp. GCM10027626]|uniref:peptidoglycan editing factor PgeF n=1 Tax=Paenibacillus sp. GCM10027626 TaxID=3273411 RepID=UPI003640A766